MGQLIKAGGIILRVSLTALLHFKPKGNAKMLYVVLSGGSKGSRWPHCPIFWIFIVSSRCMLLKHQRPTELAYKDGSHKIQAEVVSSVSLLTDLLWRPSWREENLWRRALEDVFLVHLNILPQPMR